MHFSCYTSTPSRFHPQFKGIAERYAQHKKRSLACQQKRKQLYSDRAYSIKLNERIEKQLQVKTLWLCRLKKVKQRHLEDLNFKQMLYQRRQEKIHNLKENNNKERLELKKNIEKAHNTLKSQKQRNKQQLQLELRLNDSRLERLIKMRQQQNSQRCKLVKEDQKRGHSHVDDFYRRRNERSLQDYRARITQQNKVRQRQQRKIKQYERQIATMNKTATLKREQLNQIEAQIEQLSFRSSTNTSRLRIKQRQFTELSQHRLSNISLENELNPEHSKRSLDE